MEGCQHKLDAVALKPATYYGSVGTRRVREGVTGEDLLIDLQPGESSIKDRLLTVCLSKLAVVKLSLRVAGVVFVVFTFGKARNRWVEQNQSSCTPLQKKPQDLQRLGWCI